MAFPDIDEHDIRAWELDEQMSDLTIGGTLPGFQTYSPFVDQSVNADPLTLYDSFPGSVPSKLWDVGVPGVFGGRAVAFYEGQTTALRDHLLSTSSAPEPTIFSITMVVRPYMSRPSVNGNLIQKEYNSSWTNPFTCVQMFTYNGFDGAWGFNITVGGVRQSQLIANTEETAFLRLRLQEPNVIGITYDGSVVRSYANGYVGPVLACGGPIDWGNHLLWVLGGSRALGGASNDPINAAISKVRIADVVRPPEYYFEAAIALEAQGGTGPPAIASSVAVVDPIHIDVTFDVPLTTTGEFLRLENYQVRGLDSQPDLVVSAVTVLGPTSARLTVSEMLNGSNYELRVSNLLDVDAAPVFITPADFIGFGIPPGIVLVSPAQDSEGNPRNTDIVLQITDLFSPVDLNSIFASIEFTVAFENGEFAHPFKGPRSAIEVVENGYRITIDPEDLFSYGQEVNLNVTAGDAAGNTAGIGEGD